MIQRLKIPRTVSSRQVRDDGHARTRAQAHACLKTEEVCLGYHHAVRECAPTPVQFLNQLTDFYEISHELMPLKYAATV